MGQGPFNREAVAREYRRLVEAGGRLDLDRVPDREDIHARWHWKFEGILSRDDCGRHSYMISGRGSPQLKLDEPRLEYRFRYDPMPLAWFDNPRGRNSGIPIRSTGSLISCAASISPAGRTGLRVRRCTGSSSMAPGTMTTV